MRNFSKCCKVIVLGLLFSLSLGLQAQTTYTVSNTNDSGTGSLRQAILDAEASAGADIIDMTGVSGTITLASALPVINEDLTINGAGSGITSVDGADLYRPFFILSGEVTFRDLTIQNGYAQGENTGNGGAGAGMGGAIYVDNGDLNLRDVVLDGNVAQGGNGGVTGISSGGAGPFDTGGAEASSGANGNPGQTGEFGSGGGAGGSATVYGGGSNGRGGTGGFGAGGGAPGVPYFNAGAVAPGGTGGTFGGSTNSLNSTSSSSARSGGGGAGLGGAVFIRMGSLDMNSVTFTNNTANKGLGGTYSNDGQGKGGAVFIMDGVASAGFSVTFSSNSATDAADTETDNTDGYGDLGIISVVTIETDPTNQTADEGTEASFSVTASGSGLTYQWQVFTGGFWVNLPDGNGVSGATTATLDLTCVTAAMDGYQTRCVVGGTLTTETSESATLTVNAAAALEVTISGENTVYCESGAEITYTATPTNNVGTPSYKWYVNDVEQSSETAETFTVNVVEGDVVSAELYDPTVCYNPSPAVSNDITISLTTSGATFTVTNTSSDEATEGSLPWVANQVANFPCPVEELISVDLSQLPENSVIDLSARVMFLQPVEIFGAGPEQITIRHSSGEVFRFLSDYAPALAGKSTIRDLSIEGYNYFRGDIDILNVNVSESTGTLIKCQNGNVLIDNVTANSNLGSDGIEINLCSTGTCENRTATIQNSKIIGDGEDNGVGINFTAVSGTERLDEISIIDTYVKDHYDGIIVENTVAEVTVTNVSSSNHNGFGIELYAQAVLSNCTFSSNGYIGIGAYAGAGKTTTINNCTVARNSGGVRIWPSEAIINNSIILANGTEGNRNDIETAGDGTWNSTYGHNIYHQEYATEAGDIVTEGNQVIVTNYNDNALNTVPVIEMSLSDPAGTGLMVHELVCSSPAIDAGSDMGFVSLDQLGNQRLGYADVGSFESQDGISTQPVDVFIDPTIATTPVVISVVANGASLTYQWQVNDGSGFVDIGLADTDYSGTDTNELTIVSPSSANSYRVEVTTACETYTSNEAFIDELIIWDGTDWSNVTGPVSGDNVVLKGDLPFVGDIAIEVNDLTIESGVTLTIGGGATATITGDISSAGNIIVASGSSLITFEGNVVPDDIVVQRNTRYADGKYSFVGTPVEQSALNMGSGLGAHVYKYNEETAYGTDGINRWEDASADELVAAKGYTQANQQLIEFEGRPNMGTITYEGTYTEDTDDANEGWNLVANPYTAAISVSDFLEVNTNTTGAVYIWDDNGSNIQRGSNSDYIVANGMAATQNSSAGNDARYNLHLGSAQGFFVQLDGLGTNDIEFSEGMREASNNADDNYFRKDVETTPLARINLINEDGLFKQTVIGWVTDAIDGMINRAYDARLLSLNVPYAIFSIKDNEHLAISGISLDQKRIPVGVKVDAPGNYSLTISTEAYSGENLYLFDKETNETHSIADGSYSFHADKGIVTDRFELLLGIENVLSITKPVDWLVYVADHELHIQSNVESFSREYRLYDLSGMTMKRFYSNQEHTKVNVSGIRHGVYIITDGANAQKIIIE